MQPGNNAQSRKAFFESIRATTGATTESTALPISTTTHTSYPMGAKMAPADATGNPFIVEHPLTVELGSTSVEPILEAASVSINPEVNQPQPEKGDGEVNGDNGDDNGSGTFSTHSEGRRRDDERTCYMPEIAYLISKLTDTVRFHLGSELSHHGYDDVAETGRNALRMWVLQMVLLIFTLLCRCLVCIYQPEFAACLVAIPHHFIIAGIWFLATVSSAIVMYEWHTSQSWCLHMAFKAFYCLMHIALTFLAAFLCNRAVTLLCAAYCSAIFTASVHILFSSMYKSHINHVGVDTTLLATAGAFVIGHVVNLTGYFTYFPSNEENMAVASQATACAPVAAAILAALYTVPAISHCLHRNDELQSYYQMFTTMNALIYSLPFLIVVRLAKYVAALQYLLLEVNGSAAVVALRQRQRAAGANATSSNVRPHDVEYASHDSDCVGADDDATGNNRDTDDENESVTIAEKEVEIGMRKEDIIPENNHSAENLETLV